MVKDKSFWRVFEIMIFFHLGTVSMGLAAYNTGNSPYIDALVLASTIFLYSTYYITWFMIPVFGTVAIVRYIKKNKEVND